ncbi:N-acetylglucosamine kinase [Paenibacillus tyrfis]|uniref:N-acetylglucosamine kinase n=1 Tax=Paenibacillus tyrfis TaxID=1501230 RepID=UPI0020A085D8|nr:BadF/BadG/BcrA/BcrD ATPase family protein [Paenibacillus tyrfis]MCP1306647.1 ATPase [Paenibacillus tyrfis]
MRYIIGVDGGGTKTYAVVIDEQGNKRGSGIAGCGNHQIVGIDKALGNIRQSVELAVQGAGLTYADIAFVQYGLAGADRERDFSILRPALATLPFANWDVVCDTMEGLRIGCPDNAGVVLVCGSGTNAAGRNEEGRTIQTGGLGTLYGDAAGSHYMATRTFQASVRSWEYREIPSVLQYKVPRYFGFDTVEQMVNDFLDRDIYSLREGNLTIVLHEAADEGDALAIRILQETGRELGIAACSVIRRLGGFRKETIPIVLVGSVVQKGRNPHLLAALKETVRQEHGSIELIIPEMAPVYGAVLLGMDHLGLASGESIHSKFAAYGGYEA